jgi:hypothetical protein
MVLIANIGLHLGAGSGQILESEKGPKSDILVILDIIKLILGILADFGLRANITTL